MSVVLYAKEVVLHRCYIPWGETKNTGQLERNVLCIDTVGDNFISYFNDVEVGRTGGWNRVRRYVIDPKLIKFCEENVVCITVYKVNARGVNYKPLNYLGIKAIEIDIEKNKVS